MVGKKFLETSIASGCLLLIFYSLYVRYVDPDTRKKLRSTKWGRTLIDGVAFIGTPIFVHNMEWQALMMSLVTAAIVAVFLSWPEIKENFKRRFFKKPKEAPNG